MQPLLNRTRPAQHLVEDRVFLEALRLSRHDYRINLPEVASKAKASLKLVEKVLREATSQAMSSSIEVTAKARLEMALRVARHGQLAQTARVLTWQEFEMFTEECLTLSGFACKKGVVAKYQGRKWQVDVVARRGQMTLLFDCKHWNSPSYPSKFKLAAEHQKIATLAVIRDFRTGLSQRNERAWALPIIVTLLDPRTHVSRDVVLVSIEQLPDFLNHITPYSEGMPFIPADSLAETLSA